jgi:ketosteroid isomerase-like protein
MRIRTFPWSLFVLIPVMAATACHARDETTVDLTTLEHRLLQLDREFDADCAERGSAAWVERFAPDGQLVSGSEVVVGPAAVGEAVAVLDTPEVTLRWEPTEATVATSGDLGYTRGRYRRTVSPPGGEPTSSTGSYLTVWKKLEDGRWAIALDIGSPDPSTPSTEEE